MENNSGKYQGCPTPLRQRKTHLRRGEERGEGQGSSPEDGTDPRRDGPQGPPIMISQDDCPGHATLEVIDKVNGTVICNFKMKPKTGNCKTRGLRVLFKQGIRTNTLLNIHPATSPLNVERIKFVNAKMSWR